MIDTAKMWETALLEIESAVSQANFSTWFKDTSILRQEDGIVYIGVPNSFTQEWLQKKFHNAILRILRQMNGDVKTLEYVITNEHGSVKTYKDYNRIEDINEKTESIITRVVFLTGKVESLIGRVGNLTSVVSKLTSK
ncbi:MAG: DnaA N-terminal domain-containing protein [Candidatus Paceibacterota bacterium]